MARKREVTPMETQPIRSQIEAAIPMTPAPSKQSGPKVDTPNHARPSCHGEGELTQEAAQHAARLRVG
jgi:hypothetical protein